MSLLAIDPGRSFKGEKTIGYSLWSLEEVRETGRDAWQELRRGELSFEGLQEELRVSPDDNPWSDDLWDRTSYSLLFNEFFVDEVVIEDFINNEKSRGGQRNGTSECIGAVETYCFITKTPFTRQKPAILPVAMRHAGYVQKLKHLPHQDSAYLHGYYYLTAKGVLHPKGLAGTL